MAIPPNPLAEVLPFADLVVIAEVTAIDEIDENHAPDPEIKDWTGGENTQHVQKVELSIHRVLWGKTTKFVLLALKPKAPYLLRVGVEGPFLLSKNEHGLEILGRYGPDSYSLQEIESALGSAHD